MGTEEVTLEFTRGRARHCPHAAQVNENVENIGARRLQTVMEKLLEELSFEAEDRRGETITIDEAYVEARLNTLARDGSVEVHPLMHEGRRLRCPDFCRITGP
jgi:ATP-dependent HslUV protease ATP-binding subunit HslU